MPGGVAGAQPVRLPPMPIGAALSFDCLPLPVTRPRLAIIAACPSLLRSRAVVGFLSMLREVNSYDLLLMSRHKF